MNNEPTKLTFTERVWKVVKWPLFVVLLFLLGLTIYWAFWPYRAPEGTGFVFYDSVTDQMRARTLWDWLGLLIIPAVLALGALWFNTTQKETELRIAEKARAKDREIAENARAADLEIAEQSREKDRQIAERARAIEREIAESRQRQATLEAYYDRMTDLLLVHSLREAAADEEARSIAQARTVAVVRSLDAERNRQLFAFLRTSKLIASDTPIIDLSGVDLSGANLSGTNLSGICLCKVNLRGGDLSATSLHEVNLSEANLDQTNLSQAYLHRANLSSTYLDQANLSGASLGQANLSGSYLTKANLSWAFLSDANLTGASLEFADLHGAVLEGAILIHVDLSGAKNWTFEQLERASTLEASIMPDRVKLKSLTGEDDLTYKEWKEQFIAKQNTGLSIQPSTSTPNTRLSIQRSNYEPTTDDYGNGF